MRKAMLSVLASGLAVSATLIGQTGISQAASSGTTTIVFYEAMGAALGQELQKLTDEFQKANPNIKVQLVYNSSYTVQQQKLTAAIAAGQPPTIAQVQDGWEQKYVDDNLLQPMKGTVSNKTINDLAKIWVDDNTFSGKLYSVPFNRSAYVLYYNTDDFQKAGIKNPPKTWVQLEADAKKLTKNGVYGLGLQPNFYTFEMLLHQAGGQTLNKAQNKATFNTPAGKSALNFMMRLVQLDRAATVIGANSYLSDGFNAGTYAMDLDTTAAMTYINNPSTHFKVAPLPGDKQKAVPTAGTNIAMFKSATAAQKAAAAKYLEFLLSPNATIDWAENTGYLPVLKSDLKNKAWLKYVAAHSNEAVAPKEMKFAYYSPRVATIGSGEQEAGTHFANAVNGNESVPDALKNAAKAIDQALSGQ